MGSSIRARAISIDQSNDLIGFFYSIVSQTNRQRRTKDRIKQFVYGVSARMTDNLSKSLISTKQELSWANRGLKGNNAADGKHLRSIESSIDASF